MSEQQGVYDRCHSCIVFAVPCYDLRSPTVVSNLIHVDIKIILRIFICLYYFLDSQCRLIYRFM